METWDTANGPIPGGRWDSPQGGYQWQSGQAPATQAQTPQYGDNPTPTSPPPGVSGTFNSLIAPPSGTTTTPAPSTPAPISGGNMAALQQLFASQGGDPNNAATFNAFVSRVESQFGIAPGNMGAGLPTDFAARYNPNGTAPHPVGYNPANQTSGGVTQATVNAPGGNYNQTQNANQTGGFNTTGATTNTANQTTGGTSDQNTTGNVDTTNRQSGTQTGTIGNVGTTSGTQTGTIGNVGTSSGTQTGTQNTTTGGTTTAAGQTTNRPIDTLGFGGLLQGAATGAAANDATRNSFLTDVIQTGGQGFSSQVDQAVRNSLTGAQMTGAGDSARARAAGYAGAQVARNNMGERLSAAGQLAGPTALTSLSTAANPYIGQQQSTQGSTNATGFSNLVNDLANTQNTNNVQTQNLANTGTSNNTQTQNLANTATNIGSQSSTGSTNGATTGFSNLVGSGTETTGGTATGASSSAAGGTIPQAQQVSTGGGGCVLCTAATELGLYHNLRILRRVIAFKLTSSAYTSASRGYFFLFTPLAVWLLRHPRIAAWLYPLSRAVVYQELRLSGRRLPRSEWASFVHDIGHWLCHWVGRVFPVPRHVKSPEIERIARKNNVWFSLT